jgi:hypothetical protein
MKHNHPTFGSKRIVVLALVLSQLLLTGCLELVEEITVQKNKSGSVSYRIESLDGGSLFSNLTNMFNVSLEDQMRFEVDKFVSVLQKQPGISNVEYNLHGRTGSYYLKFDFEDSRSFSNALYAIGGSKKTLFTPDYFKISNSRFKKINFAPWLKKYLEQEEIELPSHMILDFITFKSEVKLPRDIRRVKPGDVVVRSSGRKTEQRFNLAEIVENKVDTGIRIRY